MKRHLLISIIVGIIISISMLSAETETIIEMKSNKLQGNVTGFFDLQQNTISNVQFFNTNYGIFGLDKKINTGGGYWPRASPNQYIFGSGFWFGAKKRLSNNDTILAKLVTISYNPNSGESWFVPGTIADGDSVILNIDAAKKYRVYLSTDVNNKTGKYYITPEYPSWPLWTTNTDTKYQLGNIEHDYVQDINKRNLDDYPKGPLFISGEDILSVYKDTDLRYFEGGEAKRRAEGYPMKIEVDQRVYSWGYGSMKDFIIISYVLTNKSTDTLFDAYFAYVMDMDIKRRTSQTGASNDRINYYFEDSSLNLGYAWTNTNQGEKGHNFGYMGVALLETPAINKNNYLRSDKAMYNPNEQIGLSAFPNWNIVDDRLENADRYNFLASGDIDGDTGPGDKRGLLSTGPFHLKPGDKCRIAVAISFALPSKGEEADGSVEDIADLVALTKFAKDKYYEFLPTSVANDAFAKATELNIYPNPASEIINLPNELDISEPYIIYNVSGNIVTEGKTIQEIGISQLQVGMYLLYVDGQVYKFLKK